MTPEKLAELEALEAAATTPGEHVTIGELVSAQMRLEEALRNNARDLFAALREAWRERDEARAALEEREGDMHARIREGYDRTVADSWRAHCAKLEEERP